MTDKVEEVKKIAEEKFHEYYFTDKSNAQVMDELAHEICQLFEPKPDEGRLLAKRKVKH